MKWGGEETLAGAMVTFFPWHRGESFFALLPMDFPLWLPPEAQAMPGTAHSSLQGFELPKQCPQPLLLLTQVI